MHLEFKNFAWPWHNENLRPEEKDCTEILKNLMCAFLNTEGGVLLIGVKDSTCEVFGVQLSHKMKDEVVLYFQNIVLGNFHPKL
jgi:predicted HTH transcriptional regulator